MNMRIAALLLSGLLAPSAQAGLVLVAHPSSSAKPTVDDVKALLMGRSNNLPGGGNVLLGLPKEGKIREDLLAFIGKNESQYKAVWSQLMFTGKAAPPSVSPGDDEVKKWVAATPNAVGIIDSAKVDASVKVVFQP